MGYLALGVLVLTIIAIVFGMLFGMGRGRNRSILRLILIIGCVLGAFFLRGTITEIIMGIDTGEGTMAEMITTSLGGEDPLPEGMQTFVVSIVEVLIGLVAYFVAFFVLRLITWLIIFPICKIFVKKELEKKRGWGALIGLIQGIVIAFAVLAPASGLIGTMNSLTKLEIEGEPMLAVEEEFGVETYKDSFIGKTYLTIGGWYYELIAPKLDDSASAMGCMMGVAQSIQDFSNSMEIINSGEKSELEKADELKVIGESLKDIGAQLENLSEGAEEIVNELFSSMGEMLGEEGEELSPELEDFINNFDVSELDITALGEAIVNIGEYFEKTSGGSEEEFSQEDAQAIVNGFVQNEWLLNLLESEGSVDEVIDISYEYEYLFESALESVPAGTDVAKIKTILGIA